MFGDRLRIQEGSRGACVQWRRFTFADVIAVFGLPMAVVWGVASALGVEEVSADLKVIPMSMLATAIYWTVVALLTAHFVFNRGASLIVTPSEIRFQLGRVPGRPQVVERSGSVSTSIETREDPIAESDATGRTPDRTTLSIWGSQGVRIVIDDLSEDDAGRVKALIENPT